MPARSLTIPSLISLSRIILVVPLSYLVLSDLPNARWWAAGVLVLAVATDFLDGYLARRLHQVSEFGKIIDPLADKIGVGVFFVVLVVSGDIELWVGIVIILRDLLLLAGAIYIQKKKGITVQSNWPGKVAVTAMAVLALVSLLRIEELGWFRDLTLWFVMLMIALSLFLYTKRLFIGRQKDVP
jgi:CDP-diacylglycerol--glycerol-3-phosphate 3-phosphatidyltransferase